MTAIRSRGFTLIELLITLSILGCIGVGGLLLVVRYYQVRSTPLFDSNDPAREWAESLKYSFVASNCTNSLAAGGYVRCTVRVLEQQDPIPLECGIISKRCSIMKASNQ